MTDNDMTIDITSWGETLTCRPEVDTYANGRLCLALAYFDEEMQMWAPHCKVTTNLPDQHLNEGEFFVKDWSENEPVVAELVRQGWLRDTGREVISGFIAPRVMVAQGALAEFLDRA